MNKSVKLGALTATVLLAACATGGGQGPSPSADPNNAPGYVINGMGNPRAVVMNGFGNCYHNGFFTPADALAGCDDGLLPKAPPPPAQPPAPVVPPPAPQPRSEKVTYSADTFFDFDKSKLKPAGRAKLDELADNIKAMQALEVIVAVGHTDGIGSVPYNQRLSVRRAEAVKSYLVSKGIEANRVYTEGKGKSQPVATNKTAAGRAQNRRVEVEVVGTREINR